MTAELTISQQYAISHADTYLKWSGLPTYTELLALLEKHSRPLPAAQTIWLGGTQPEDERGIDVRDERRGLTWAPDLACSMPEVTEFIAEHPELKP